VVDHEDSDHRIDRAGILPRPKRKIPIWLGGFSEAAFDRAARIGDGFLFSGRTQTEAIQIKARIVAKRLTENELSDFSRLWHDGCVDAIIEVQDVDRNHSTQV
jgi:alkanesulfonate monooxygenase SsuD/methylene tetrahydromethanopterin reductase-like flavin-dependent oxidoreductase (luciferase family)